MTVVDRRGAWTLLLLLVLVTAGCGGGGDREAADDTVATAGAAGLVVYSGPDESLIGPLLARFEEVSGIDVEVRYGSTRELTATLLEEGEHTPADVFLSRDAAALGALAERDFFAALPADLLERVEPRFRGPNNDWVGLSGRARAIVYNPESISLEELPASLSEVAAERYRGRFGVAPTDGSFQAHMAVYSAVNGPDALDELLTGLAANEPRRYPKNSALVEAVFAAEVDFGLTDHDSLWRALAEQPNAPGRNFFHPGSGASGFVDIAGVGVLRDAAAARELVAFLLGAEAQAHLAGETYEVPLAAGVQPTVELPPLAQLATPDLDFGDVSAVLEGTLRQIAASGLAE